MRSPRVHMDVALVTKFLFPAPHCSYEEWSFKGELVWVEVAQYESRGADDSTLPLDYAFPCLALPCESAEHLVIYFHRNGEDLGSCRAFCQQLRDRLRVHVLAVEYPGYGLCGQTSPNTALAVRHASAALGFAQRALGWPLNRTILFGQSVGTCLAMSLAASFPEDSEAPAGLVLAAPLLSVRDAVRQRLGALAAKCVTEQFPNEALAARVRCPTLVIHGQQDTIVPPWHGQKIYDALLGCRKHLLTPNGVGHSSCLLQCEGHLLAPMAEFFGFSTSSCSGSPLAVPPWALRRQANFTKAARQRSVNEGDGSSQQRASSCSSPASATGRSGCLRHAFCAPRGQSS